MEERYELFYKDLSVGWKHASTPAPVFAMRALMGITSEDEVAYCNYRVIREDGSYRYEASLTSDGKLFKGGHGKKEA